VGVCVCVCGFMHEFVLLLFLPPSSHSSQRKKTTGPVSMNVRCWQCLKTRKVPDKYEEEFKDWQQPKRFECAMLLGRYQRPCGEPEEPSRGHRSEELPRGRWPDHSGIGTYKDRESKTQPRFCLCSYAVFLKSTSLEVQCDQCEYWYHTECTSDLHGATPQQLARVTWQCPVCKPL
jgi:hypothetical protein